jgi:Holliday junction resolvasome RuvABC ATP-dependent DNA helicase subunit
MSRAEITTPEVLADESVVELSLRPQRLAEFIGQQKVKEMKTEEGFNASTAETATRSRSINRAGEDELYRRGVE